MKILHPARPPVGPDGNTGHHSYFHAPEGHRRAKGMALVNGGSRGCVAWRREALPNRRLHTSPSAFLVSFWASKKKLAAGAAKYPAKRERTARRVVAPYKNTNKESREKRRVAGGHMGPPLQ